MKVQLIVVQGKPEGKIIPLPGPTFKIGRGEACHLRPNSEQVSREHSEFTITPEKVVVRDLGSRNGTLVNGKALTEPCTLKDRDLIQVGPLTFAISIEGAAVPAAKGAAPAPSRAASPDDISNADIESWLVADNASPTPERPSGVYGGDTRTINTYQGKPASGPDTPVDSGDADEAPPDEEVETENEDEVETIAEEGPSEEEFIDESNPFYAAKKKAQEQQAPVKPAAKDSSDAAGDILRKLMERRRGSR
jgi:hypothetical protein